MLFTIYGYCEHLMRLRCRRGDPGGWSYGAHRIRYDHAGLSRLVDASVFVTILVILNFRVVVVGTTESSPGQSQQPPALVYPQPLPWFPVHLFEQQGWLRAVGNRPHSTSVLSLIMTMCQILPSHSMRWTRPHSSAYYTKSHCG